MNGGNIRRCLLGVFAQFSSERVPNLHSFAVQFELSAHGKSRILANATPGGTGSASTPTDKSSALGMSAGGPSGVSSGLAVPAAGAGALAMAPAAMLAGGKSGEVPPGHVQVEAGGTAGRLPDVSPAAASTSFGKPGMPEKPDMPDMPGMKAEGKIPAMPDAPDMPDVDVSGVKAPEMPDVKAPELKTPDTPDVKGSDMPDAPDVSLPDVKGPEVPDVDVKAPGAVLFTLKRCTLYVMDPAKCLRVTVK